LIRAAAVVSDAAASAVSPRITLIAIAERIVIESRG
jgi:hypothetical protein